MSCNGIGDFGKIGMMSSSHEGSTEDSLLVPRSSADYDLLTSIDHVFSALGSATKEALLFYMRSISGMEISQLIHHPAEFNHVLDSVLGSGAKVLETRLAEELESHQASSEGHENLLREIQSMNHSVGSVSRSAGDN